MNSIGIVEADLKNKIDQPQIKQITFDLKLSRARWTKDSAHLLALRYFGAYRQIYSVSLKTGEVKQITNAPLDISSFEISPDGSKIVWSEVVGVGWTEKCEK